MRIIAGFFISLILALSYAKDINIRYINIEDKDIKQQDDGWVDQGINFIGSLWGDSEPKEEPKIVYYERVPNSPYVIIEGQLYRQRIETKSREHCESIICGRFERPTYSYSNDVYYDLVDATLDLSNLHTFGKKKAMITDGKIFIIRDEIAKNIELLSDFDPTKQRYEDGDHYFIVDHVVFNHNRVIPNVNGREFQAIQSGYFKDNQYVYRGSERLDDIDANSFEEVNAYFIQDKDSVYKNSAKFEKTHFKPKLQSLKCQHGSCYYVKNDTQVTYRSDEIKGADAQSFEVLKYSYGMDHELTKGLENIWFDVVGFPYLHANFPDEYDQKNNDDNVWSKDKNNVYFRGKFEPELDAKTVQKIKIKNNLYVVDHDTLMKQNGTKIQYNDFIAGPIPVDGFYSNEPLFVDAQGFFEMPRVINRESYFLVCHYGSHAPSKLKPMDTVPDGMAYAFENDHYEYYIRGHLNADAEKPDYRNHKVYRNTDDVLAIKDYMIEKSTGQKYVLFKNYTDCGSWDDVIYKLR